MNLLVHFDFFFDNGWGKQVINGSVDISLQDTHRNKRVTVIKRGRVQSTLSTHFAPKFPPFCLHAHKTRERSATILIFNRCIIVCCIAVHDVVYKYCRHSIFVYILIRGKLGNVPQKSSSYTIRDSPCYEMWSQPSRSVTSLYIMQSWFWR